MDRHHELEYLRRSATMAGPGQQPLTREQALALIAELDEMRRRLDQARTGLRKLIEDLEDS